MINAKQQTTDNANGEILYWLTGKEQSAEQFVERNRIKSELAKSMKNTISLQSYGVYGGKKSSS